jgi:hypothetical protein
MFTKVGVLIGAFAVATVVAAPAAQAAPCAWFGDHPSNGICGLPNLQQSASNAQKNLQNNFSVPNALGNLGYALTHGVGVNG